MSRLRAVLGVMIALLWAPVTAHCMFERLPGFQFLSCCAHEDADATAHETEDCSGDVCAVLEKGFYKIKENGDTVPKPTLTLAFLVDAIAAPVFSGIDSGEKDARPAPPPPSLKTSWQFSYRTAVPIRAPSVIA